MWRGSVERGVNEAIHAPLADSRRRSVRTQIRYLPTDTVTFTNLPPVFQDTATGPSPHPPLFKGKGRAPEPLAGRAPAVPAAVPSAWPKAPSTASAPTTPSRTHAPAAPQQQRAAPSSDESCACTRARRRTRERDAAAGPRPAARVPAARRRRHHCSFAFARCVRRCPTSPVSTRKTSSPRSLARSRISEGRALAHGGSGGAARRAK